MHGALRLDVRIGGRILAEGSIFSYPDGSTIGGGSLAGYIGGAVDMTTPELQIPTGVPLTLQIQLSSISDALAAYHPDGSSAEASSEAELWLPLNTPLFNLPEGFTVNSLDGAIVDNIYTVVPETEHYLALAGAGLALFGLYRRARRP